MKHKVLWLVSLVSVLALAACAGGTRKITIVGEDYHYDAEVWSAAPGQTVELTFTNNGSAEHEWVIIKLGESVSVPFDDDDEPKVFWEIEAEPGETKTETFTAPTEPGEYQVVCGTPTHLEQGMYAQFVVK